MTPGRMLLPTPAPGVCLYTGEFEAVVHGISSALTGAMGLDGCETLRTPPVIARSVIERVGYEKSFPHLLGSVFAQEYDGTLGRSDVALLPAGCYCVYPHYENAQVAAPTVLSVEATCFRQESTSETGRLRSFRMREMVWLGPEGECRPWRDTQLVAARDWLTALEIDTERAVATDPFFGSGSRMVQMLQAEQELKIELLADLGEGRQQAVASGNYHKDQFGRLFAITDEFGRAAHTACVAFGYERLALALLRKHGQDIHVWPARVQQALNLEAGE